MKKFKIVMTLLIVIGLAMGLMAREPEGFVPTPLAKTSLNQTNRTMSNISNWGYWMYSTGKSAQKPNGNSGGVYPRGTAGAIYQDGLVWGGKFAGQSNDIRLGGVTYSIGTVGGWINADGTAASPSDPRVKIWRIRPDWETLTYDQVRQDAMELNELEKPGDVTDAMCQAVIDQYKEDWENWPVDLGAPYIDVDGDGQYNGNDYPGIADADQVVWLVTNDLDRTACLSLGGSEPMGIELQITAWAYAQPGARLGQIVFKKYKFINKSGQDITDVYVSQWCDPDLGSASDDYVGCDTTLSLGFAYNGGPTDNDYTSFGLAPAAIGYDFFQGPLVDGVAGQDVNRNGIDDADDYAVFDLKQVGPGKVNLPMSSFGWFAAGSPISDPTLGEYEGTLQWYNLMSGYKPTDDVLNPSPWTLGNIEGNPTTKFPLAGDPVAGTGYIDGADSYFPPGDRRMCLTSGPFNFPNGATQEVVVAVVGGLGDNNLSSLADLKLTDEIAQTLYNKAFAGIPKAPKGPEAGVIPFEDEIIIDWGSNLTAVAATEDPVIAGYAFEGYNVYQLPSASSSIDEALKIATFDLVNGVTTIMGKKFLSQYGAEVLVPVQKGLDNGVKRFMKIEKDYITGKPLYEGKTYYFAVTAYNYNAAPTLIEAQTLESAMIGQSVTVQESKPGDQMSEEHGNVFEITHNGPSDGQVSVQVIDPNKLTGESYTVFFELDLDTNSATYNEYVWGVKDASGNVKFHGQPQAASLDAATDAPIFDGVQVRVSGPALGVKAIYETDADGNIVDPKVTPFFGASLGTTGYLLSNRYGGIDNAGTSRDFDRFNYWGMDDLEIDFTEQSLTWDYINETVHMDPATGSATYAPFSMYRYVFATNTKLRLFAGYWDADGSGTWNMPYNEDGTPQWEGPIYHAPSYEPVYAWVGADASGIEIPYDPAKEAQYIADNSLLTSAGATWGGGNHPVIHYPYVTATLFTMYLDGATPPFGHKVYFALNKPNTDQDEFTFTSTAPTLGDEELAKEQVKMINVFPNPYYANNDLGTTRFDDYVTFTHLPEKATVRIFSLSGIQVRVLEKNDPTQFLEWDLQNEAGLPVGSGMYIAYIDLPDLGKEKVLKLAIIQKEQILEYY
ncbi:MAG: T9SS type A sorting domain-containing protein [Candidatus Marinimicrobia bacterium]|nr:T9SS type A sorting domain-containing protein [Candidatus Neomarinimicrobiota bacterium]